MSEETKQHPGCGRSYVVCGAAGGQGTTLVAELLYEALREGGTPAKLAGVHFTEDECRSHIAMLYPEALDVKISLMAVRENGLTLLGQMDEIDDVMAAADPAVIDLGSGFADLFSIWARETCGTELVPRPMDVLLVARPQEHALQAALRMLPQLEEARGRFGAGRTALVLNGLQEEFEDMPSFRTLCAVSERDGIPLVALDTFDPMLINQGWSIGALRRSDVDQVVAAGSGDVARMRAFDMTRAWISRSTAALRAAGVGPA
ncbi:MAG TPA: hypothetical protein P5256_01360 [Beijerinckiaceae bacterium]|nr:hypothetical protein [Hyphomicrobiales bacterium]HRY01744.1 hypothetical protein [Beijerinckiaceae bacterium]